MMVTACGNRESVKRSQVTGRNFSGPTLDDFNELQGFYDIHDLYDAYTQHRKPRIGNSPILSPVMLIWI